MAVNFIHPEYEELSSRWAQCRACREGEEAIKKGGTNFLPKLSGQSDKDYAHYLTRASYYNATARTVDALTGMLFLKPPTHKMPTELEKITKTIGESEETAFQLCNNIADELVTLGRCAALVDASTEENAAPYVAILKVESIINWRFETIDGVKQPVLIVIQECRNEPGEDIFETVEKDVWRVLLLDIDPVTNQRFYRVELWERIPEEDKSKEVDAPEFRKFEDIVPRFFGGKLIPYIPIQIFDAEGSLTTISKPPILDLVNINLAHFRNSADHEWGLHFVALPTPVVIGGNFQIPKGGTGAKPKLPLGSTTAWDVPNEKASVLMLEFSGAGLGAIAAAMDRKEKQMAIVGGRMLEQQKNQVERSEAVKLRMVGDSSVLAGVADQLSLGMTWILKIVAEWQNIGTASERETIVYTVSRDFVAFSVDPAMLSTIALLVQQNLLSYEDFYELAKRASLVPMDRTLTDHLSKVKNASTQAVMLEAATALKELAQNGKTTAGSSGPPTSPQ